MSRAPDGEDARPPSSDNNTGLGGATPHTGRYRIASIERSAGDATAMDGLDSKVRSAYHIADGIHYKYTSVPGSGWGGNVER